MKLNPDKCVFAALGKTARLHRFLAWHRVQPRQDSAISKLGKPGNLKEVQKLARCVATLSLFISRLDEKALPLYRLLKKSDKFV